jgi:tetratricopeptide (TPR) repeat protein
VSKVKIRRKDLRQPDEFVEFTGRAWRWLRDNQTTAIGAVVLGVLVFAGISGLRQYRDYRAANAAESFRRGVDLLAAGDAAGAEKVFGELAAVAAYGALADLYRGHAALEAEDYPAAASAFQAAAGRPELPPYLRQQALYNLGVALGQQGDSAGAQARYEEAAELTGPFTVDAQVAAAQLSDAAGQTRKARELYQQAVGEAEGIGPSQDDLRQLAEARLAALGGPIPEAKE